jgi:thymidylate synthase (FAD)
MSMDARLCRTGFRERAESVKQGSGDLLPPPQRQQALAVFQDSIDEAADTYRFLLELQAAPEQARAVLPLATLTTWVWTGSLYGFARVYDQRMNDHAQLETREVVMAIGAILSDLYPRSWPALIRYGAFREKARMRQLRELATHAFRDEGVIDRALE